MEINIRKVKVEDAKRLAEIQSTSWPFAHVNKEYNISKEDIANHLGDLEYNISRFEKYATNDSIFHVIEVNGQVIGYANMFCKDSIWEGATYLDPEYTGRGLGTKLLQSVLDELPEGAVVISEVAVYNERSKGLLKHFGFEEMKERGEYKLRNSEKSFPTVKMRKNL